MISIPRVALPFSPKPEADGAVRHDGWNAERRIAFLEALAAGYKVAAAARHAGMTPQSARKLRNRAPEFADWDETFALITAQIEESAIYRAIYGSERPVFSRGRQVVTRVYHHDRLALQLLAFRDPMRYAPLPHRAAWLKATGALAGQEDECRQNMTKAETSETWKLPLARPPRHSPVYTHQRSAPARPSARCRLVGPRR